MQDKMWDRRTAEIIRGSFDVDKTRRGRRYVWF
jgi:hypothetical protein